MALKMRQFSIAVMLTGEVEAESNDEAARIIEGIFGRGNTLNVEELDESENVHDQCQCMVASAGDVDLS